MIVGDHEGATGGKPAPRAVCACLHGVLAQALDAVMSLGADEVEAVFTVAEAQRRGVRAALASAFEAEAARFAMLSQRAYAAADRLAGCPAALSERTRARE